jgi:hypothetical protein
MTKNESDYLKGLPEQLTIYRGMTEKEFTQKTFGISWTLKQETAEFFAKVYFRNFDTNKLKKIVHQIKINKTDVIAFFNGRQEYEIIYSGKQKQIEFLTKAPPLHKTSLQ